MSNPHGFQPIKRPGRDEDSLLEELASKKGVGRMEGLPEAPRPIIAPEAPPEAAAPSRAGRGRERRGASPAGQETTPGAPTPRSRMKAMNLELPDYVLRQLKEQALRDDCSVRHIIMRGLGSQGIVIDPPDLVADGRRRRDTPAE